jgi:hypothetical protein
MYERMRKTPVEEAEVKEEVIEFGVKEEEVEETPVGTSLKKKKEKRDPRAPTKFNEFMRTKVAQVKSDNPTKSPKDIFAMCAAMWATAPENPKSSAAAALPPAKSEKGSLKSGKGKSKK